MSSKLAVNTEHSRYEFDFDRGTFTRRPIHHDASDLAPWYFGPDDVNYFHEIRGPIVGEQMVVTTPDGGWVKSTPVVSVEELDD